MANVDNLEEIEKIDQDGFLRNLQEFPEQCERCWQDWQAIPLPARFIQAKNIFITGMGGSSMGGALVSSLTKDYPIPIVIWRDYDIPGWINKDTLVIAISFSGNTEETLDSFKKATAKTDKIVTIAQGGELDILSRKYKTTHYKINYSGQPRSSFGFIFTSVLAIFSKLKLIELSEDDFREAMVLLKGLQKKIDVGIPTPNNNAKLLAKKLIDKIPVIYGSGNLRLMARRWCNEFGENAKTAAFYQELPEANHNTVNGLEFPKNLGQKIFAIILQSKFDHPRNRLRQNVLMQIFQRNRIPFESLMLEPSPTPLAELLQFCLLGAYVSYYLGIIYDSDPSQIKIVDFLKEKLAEKPMEG
jgi:glucose/mannose-6-phosphate isomerase